jgi:IS4 transposase
VLFALVANRAIDPASKLAAAEWASADVAIPGLDGMDDDQAYRAMDLLIEADAARRRAMQAAEREEAAHVKAECALREHPTLGRWLRQTSSGRLQLDRAKITAEARLDGKYLLSTSDPDLSAADVALGYKNLLEAERGFRDLKSTIELRPVFHRLEPRIRAHVLLCWLALLLIRVAERRTGQTWRHINRELNRLHAITLAGPAGTVVQTTEPTTAQSSILRACGLVPPPRITTPDPA